MKVIILILIFSFNYISQSKEKNNQIEDWKDVESLNDVRLYRFTIIPLYSYRNDTDSQIIGTTHIYFKFIGDKKRDIQQKLKEFKGEDIYKLIYLEYIIKDEKYLT